jgi:hypothetical protein
MIFNFAEIIRKLPYKDSYDYEFVYGIPNQEQPNVK